MKQKKKRRNLDNAEFGCIFLNMQMYIIKEKKKLIKNEDR